jgi:uncharacterized membrane protein
MEAGEASPDRPAYEIPRDAILIALAAAAFVGALAPLVPMTLIGAAVIAARAWQRPGGVLAS